MSEMIVSTRRRAIRLSALCVVVAVAGLSLQVQADPIQPLPRPVKGMPERVPEPTATEMPLDLKNQKGLAWKKAAVSNLKVGSAFLEQNRNQPDVKVLKNGVQYKVIKAGDGPKPKKKDSVEVYYRGVLLDGTVFVNAVTPGQPAVLKLEAVVPGLRDALKQMPAGSKWQIFVPPESGYGDNGAPPKVGPGAVLIYDLELVGIRGASVNAAETTNGGAK